MPIDWQNRAEPTGGLAHIERRLFWLLLHGGGAPEQSGETNLGSILLPRVAAEIQKKGASRARVRKGPAGMRPLYFTPFPSFLLTLFNALDSLPIAAVESFMFLT